MYFGASRATRSFCSILTTVYHIWNHSLLRIFYRLFLNSVKHISTTCWAKGRSASCGKRVMETHIGHSSIGGFLIRLPENRDRSYPRNAYVFNFILNTCDGLSPNYLLLKKGSVTWSSSCVGVLFTCLSRNLFQAVNAYLRFLNRKETYKYLTSCTGSSPCLFVFLLRYFRASFCIPRLLSLSNLNTDR